MSEYLNELKGSFGGKPEVFPAPLFCRNSVSEDGEIICTKKLLGELEPVPGLPSKCFFLLSHHRVLSIKHTLSLCLFE